MLWVVKNGAGLIAKQAGQTSRFTYGSTCDRANASTEGLASAISIRRHEMFACPNYPESNIDAAVPSSTQQTALSDGPIPTAAPMAGAALS